MSIEIGSSFTIRHTIRHPSTKALETPASVFITIKNPDSTEYQAYTSMTRESEGVYVYRPTLAVDAQIGRYCGNIKSTSSGGFIDIARIEFVTVAATCSS